MGENSSAQFDSTDRHEQIEGWGETGVQFDSTDRLEQVGEGGGCVECCVEFDSTDDCRIKQAWTVL